MCLCLYILFLVPRPQPMIHILTKIVYCEAFIYLCILSSIYFEHKLFMYVLGISVYNIINKATEKEKD